MRNKRAGDQAAFFLLGAAIVYERSGELVEDATQELSGKYRALHEHTKQLLDEAETASAAQKAPPSAGN